MNIIVTIWKILQSKPKDTIKTQVSTGKNYLLLSFTMEGWYIHEQNIWDKLKISCEIVQYEKSPISIFNKFFASIDKTFILEGRQGTRL